MWTPNRYFLHIYISTKLWQLKILKWSLPMTATDVDVLDWSWTMTDADDCRPQCMKSKSPLHRAMTDAGGCISFVWKQTLHCTEQWLTLMIMFYSCEIKLSTAQSNDWCWWLCPTRVKSNSPLNKTINESGADDCILLVWNQTLP